MPRKPALELEELQQHSESQPPCSALVHHQAPVGVHQRPTRDQLLGLPFPAHQATMPPSRARGYTPVVTPRSLRPISSRGPDRSFSPRSTGLLCGWGQLPKLGAFYRRDPGRGPPITTQRVAVPRPCRHHPARRSTTFANPALKVRARDADRERRTVSPAQLARGHRCRRDESAATSSASASEFAGRRTTTKSAKSHAAMSQSGARQRRQQWHGLQ
jgi:hypothetical protein